MVCLILQVKKTPKDDVYLVFDMNVTADDINQIVKKALGIEQTSVLEPTIDIEVPEPTIDIEVPESYGYAYAYTSCTHDRDLYLGLNPTFVKLSFTRQPGSAFNYLCNINSGKMINNDKILPSFELNATHTVAEQNVKLPKSGGDIIKNMENDSLIERFKFITFNGNDWNSENEFSPYDVGKICQGLNRIKKQNVVNIICPYS